MALTPLAVMLRPPIPGKTKTRLAKSIGDIKAADLYSAFVEDTLATVQEAACFDVTLWSAGEPDEAVESWGRSIGADIRLQPEVDLGGRIHTAITHALEQSDRCLVIGTDSPTLPSSVMIQASTALNDNELVLGPTADGGYYAIGARSKPPKLEGIRWSSPQTLTDTVEANRDLKFKLLTPWYDIDAPSDLRLLRAHLEVDRFVAPSTRANLF